MGSLQEKYTCIPCLPSCLPGTLGLWQWLFFEERARPRSAQVFTTSFFFVTFLLLNEPVTCRVVDFNGRSTVPMSSFTPTNALFSGKKKEHSEAQIHFFVRIGKFWCLSFRLVPKVQGKTTARTTATIARAKTSQAHQGHDFGVLCETTGYGTGTLPATTPSFFKA
jgi:hypothetical protein